MEGRLQKAHPRLANSFPPPVPIGGRRPKCRLPIGCVGLSPPPAGSTPLQLLVPAWFPGERGAVSRARGGARALPFNPWSERSGRAFPPSFELTMLGGLTLGERASARSFCPVLLLVPSRSERSPASGRRGLRLHLAPTCLAPSPCDLTAYYHTRPVRFHSDEGPNSGLLDVPSSGLWAPKEGAAASVASLLRALVARWAGIYM